MTKPAPTSTPAQRSPRVGPSRLPRHLEQPPSQPLSQPPAAPPTAPPALLDIAGAARRLGTPQRFVRRLVAERRVPFHKVGRYVRFDPRDLDTYLADNRVDARDAGGRPLAG